MERVKFPMDQDYKLQLIRHYNKKAEDREEQKWDWKIVELDQYIEHLNKADVKNVLDVGCGTGNEMIYMEEKGFKVKGIDLAPLHIEICKKRTLDAYEMDFYNINFTDQEFDAMYAVSSLLHVPKSNLHIVLKEMHRCLKSEGLCYFGLFKGFYDGVLPSMDNKYIALYQTDEFTNLIDPYFSIVETRSFRISKKERYLSVIAKKKE